MPARNHTNFVLAVLVSFTASTGGINCRGEAESERLKAELARLNNQVQQLQSELERAREEGFSLRRELSDREEVLRSWRKNSIQLCRVGARTRVVCDEPLGLRNPLNPVLDKENPRIGTLIKLTGANGDELHLTNLHFAVSYTPMGQRRASFDFTYSPINEDAIEGRGIGDLENFDTLWVRYLPLLQSVGYCSTEARLELFALTVNDIEVASAYDLGNLVGDSSRFPIQGVMRNLSAKYFDKLASGSRGDR